MLQYEPSGLQEYRIVNVYLYLGFEVVYIWIGRLKRYGLACWLKGTYDPPGRERNNET